MEIFKWLTGGPKKIPGEVKRRRLEELKYWPGRTVSRAEERGTESAQETEPEAAPECVPEREPSEEETRLLEEKRSLQAKRDTIQKNMEEHLARGGMGRDVRIDVREIELLESNIAELDQRLSELGGS